MVGASSSFCLPSRRTSLRQRLGGFSSRPRAYFRRYTAGGNDDVRTDDLNSVQSVCQKGYKMPEEKEKKAGLVN
jgi:hypothetical protein